MGRIVSDMKRFDVTVAHRGRALWPHKTAALTKESLCNVSHGEGNRKFEYLAKWKDMSVKTNTSALYVTYAHIIVRCIR